MLNLPGDLIEYIFGFLDQDEILLFHGVHRGSKKHVALRVLYKLKITGKESPFDGFESGSI